MHNMSKCRCPHHCVFGALVFLFGLMFLLHTTGMLSDSFVSYGWPILVMAAGLHKLIEGMCACCGKMGKGMEKEKGCEGGACATGEQGGCCKDGEGHDDAGHDHK